MDPRLIKSEVKRIRLSKFDKYYLNEETKDMTFVVNGVKIAAHKIILSSTSRVFENMFFSQTNKNKEVTEETINVDDTTVDAFKLFLKFIYFDELDAIDINQNPSTAIELFVLSNRFDIKLMSTLIEEELVKLISFETLVRIANLATNYNSVKLNEAVNEFVAKNEKLIVSQIESKLVSDKIENCKQMITLFKLSQKQIINALLNIYDQNQRLTDCHKYRLLIQFELCSVKDLNTLKTIRGLFDSKLLDKQIEQKFEDLENKLKLSSKRLVEMSADLDEKNIKLNDLSKMFSDLNTNYTDLMTNYKEVKEVFVPFAQGLGGRVNQYVYSKSNTYLGKLPKNFTFKY